MDKYAVKKPRSIFDTLPDLSDPGREQYAVKEGRKSKPQWGQTSMLDVPFGSGGSAVASNPPVTAQRSLVAGGESVALPSTKAPETTTKTIKGRQLSDERRTKKLQDDTGNWFHIHNQDIHGLPPDADVKLVRYLVHEGKLFRLSHVDHPEHGKFIHVEHGTEVGF